MYLLLSKGLYLKQFTLEENLCDFFPGSRKIWETCYCLYSQHPSLSWRVMLYCSQPVIASWKEAVIASHPLPLENSTSSFSTFYILRELLFPSTATLYISIWSIFNITTTQTLPLPLKWTFLLPAPNCCRPPLLNGFLQLFPNILMSCDFERRHGCERGLGFSQNSLFFPMPAF